MVGSVTRGLNKNASWTIGFEPLEWVADDPASNLRPWSWLGACVGSGLGCINDVAVFVTHPDWKPVAPQPSHLLADGFGDALANLLVPTLEELLSGFNFHSVLLRLSTGTSDENP